MSGDWRYGHVEAALARLHGVPEERVKAFRARIRHLRNVGIPQLPAAGSGRHIQYTRDHVAELYVGLELLHCLWSPQGVAMYVRTGRIDILRHCELAISCPDKHYSIGIFSKPLNYSLGNIPTTEKDHVIAEWFFETDDVMRHIGDEMKDSKHPMPRATIVSLSPHLARLHQYLDEAAQ